MTMNEELINQIVRRILSEPSLQGLLQGKGGQKGNPTVRSEALVLLNYVSDFPRVLTAVQRQWGANYKLSILPSDQVCAAKPVLPAGMTWTTVQDAMGKSDWQKLILPTCSPNTLAKAALGIRDNPICEMIGRGISKGCSIELVTEYLGLTAQTPQAYRDLYEGYLKKVQTYGFILRETLEEDCTFASDNGTVPASHSTSVGRTVQQQIIHPEQTSGSYGSKKTAFHEESASTREEIHFVKKFLGDKQACGFPEESRVHVKQGTVVSPLARDTLKLRRIELCIVKEGGRG